MSIKINVEFSTIDELREIRKLIAETSDTTTEGCCGRCDCGSSHINNNHGRFVFTKRCNTSHNQIRTGLSRVFNLNIQAGLQTRTNNQCSFTR